MRNQLQARLSTLKEEFQSGGAVMAEIEARQAKLRDSLLRIAGAIQVLEEELAKDAQRGYPAADADFADGDVRAAAGG